MDTDYKEELNEFLKEYVVSELKENGIDVEEHSLLQREIEALVSDTIDTAIEAADDFINEKVEELTEEVADDDGVPWNPKEQWDTGKPGRVVEGVYGQSGANGYGKNPSGVSEHDSDRWKDAWGDK